MDYLTAKEVSEIWGIKPRMVMTYCSRDRIPGAIKKGNMWLIPHDAVKPLDGRTKEAKAQRE